MKYVLDASVGARAFLPEAYCDKAVRLLDDYRQALHEFLAISRLEVDGDSELADVVRREVGRGLGRRLSLGELPAAERVRTA